MLGYYFTQSADVVTISSIVDELLDEDFYFARHLRGFRRFG